MNSTTPLQQWSLAFDVRWWLAQALRCLRSWLTPETEKVAVNDVDADRRPSARYDNIVSLTCHYAWHLWTRRIETARWSDVERRVLASQRVLAASAGGDLMPARQHLARLRCQVSPGLLRIASWILYRLLSRIFATIQFSRKQIDKVRQQARDTPVIYLPVHRSRLDCLLVSFILYMNDLSPPLVAVDETARMPFFSRLLRGLGAFYVDRAALHADAPLYRAVLQSYVSESLRHGHSVQLFVEPTATATGKPQLPPHIDLLDLVRQALSEGSLPDVCVVPVSISYEKCLQPAPAAAAPLRNTVEAIWRTLRSNHGAVRVDFGQPFLMTKYLTVEPDAGCVACPFGTIQERPSLESLARHVLHDAGRDCGLMSTHLVCFLLLNRYRKGTTVDQLAADLDWLRQTVARDKQHSLSVQGDSHAVIGQAVQLLGAQLIVTEKVRLKWSSWHRAPRKTCRGPPSTVEIVYVKPAAKLPCLLQLHYYGNTCGALFHLESVLATALYSMLGATDLAAIECDRASLVSSAAIDKRQFMERCQEICALMQREFVFVKSCQSLTRALAQTFDGLVKRDVFVLHPNQPAAITLPMAERNSHHRPSFLKVEGLQRQCILEVDEEAAARFDDQQQQHQNGSGDQFYLRVTEPNGQLLALYRSVLRPYLQAYWLVARQLAARRPAPPITPEQLTSAALQLANEGSLLYECTSEPTFRNALAYFESIGALQRVSGQRFIRWPRFELEALAARIGALAQ